MTVLVVVLAVGGFLLIATSFAVFLSLFVEDSEGGMLYTLIAGGLGIIMSVSAAMIGADRITTPGYVFGSIFLVFGSLLLLAGCADIAVTYYDEKYDR